MILKNLLSKIWDSVQSTADNINNKFSKPNQVRRGIIVLAICYCYICVAGAIISIPVRMSEKYIQNHAVSKYEDAIEAINNNLSDIQVDLSGYTSVSEPVGIDDAEFFAGEEWGNFFVDFRSKVYKNTDFPSNSVVLVEWEVYDRSGNSIGIVRSKDTENMSIGMSKYSSVMDVFDISENNIPTYNGNEIGKMVCISIEEIDNQVQLLKSEFDDKKKYLQEYIDKGDKEGFNSYLDKVLALYPPEEFPDENWELNELARQTNEHFEAVESAEQAELKKAKKEEEESKNKDKELKEEAARQAEKARENAEKLKERMIEDQRSVQDKYIDSCIYAVSQDLLRSPSSYRNKPVYVSGEVTSQVNLQKGKFLKMLERAGLNNSKYVEEVIITDMYGEIAILYDSSQTGKRFLEGDSIGAYGEMVELTEITYTNMFGVQSTQKIPQIRLRYYE